MLHASDFTRQSLHRFLLREYALEAMEITDIPGGSACLFLAACGDGRRLVVKEYQRGFDARGVRHEAALCDFLRGKGLPTARFVHTRGGETACEHRGRPVTVQEFIGGEAPENYSAAPWLLEASARLLGEIHRAMRGLPPMQEQFAPAWGAPAQIPAKRLEYEALLKKAERLEHPRAQRVMEDLRFKIKGLDWLAAQPNVTEGLTYVNTHGDYSVRQLLIRKGEIAAVLDFAGACRLPAVWEVIRSFSLASPECAGGALPVERMEAYMDAYEAVFPLGAADRLNMRRFYAAQLLRSTYGYKQFFDPAVADREEALRFGVWRTDLLRTLLQTL